MNATQIDADGYVKLETKLSGNYLNQSEITYEIVSGSEYGMLDEEGYLNGVTDGEVVVVAKITNVFGTFTSNELKIVVGAGLPQKPATEDKKGGCASTVSGIAGGVAVLGLATMALLKKKEN